MSIKLDMSKPFDRIEWTFLDILCQHQVFIPFLWILFLLFLILLMNGLNLAISNLIEVLDKVILYHPTCFRSMLRAFLIYCRKLNVVKVHLVFIQAQVDRTRLTYYSRRTLYCLEKQSLIFKKQLQVRRLTLTNQQWSSTKIITDRVVRQSITQLLNTKEVPTNDKYLGLPTIVGCSKFEVFSSIKERV